MPVSWTLAPESVMATIFSNLNIIDKMAAADVCSSWREASDHPDAWTSLDLGPDSFSSPWVSPACLIDKLNEKILHCRHLSLDIKSFPNTHVYVVLDMASRYCRRLKCIEIYDSSMLPNSGTKLQLEGLTQLLNQNKNLHHLNLERIKLCSLANKQPLPFGLCQARSLRRLRLVQSLDTCFINNMLYLVSLSHLTITPDFLYYPLISHLAQQSLKHLNLIFRGENSKRYLRMTDDQWKSVCCKCRLVVGCYTKRSNKYKNSIMGKCLLVPSMPLRSFVYNDSSPFPYSQLWELLLSYSSTLEEFVDFSLGGDWIDSHQQTQVALIFAECFPLLRVFSTQVLLNSTDLLILATKNPNLAHLVIKEDQVIYNDKLFMEVCVRFDLTRRQVDHILSHSGSRTLLEAGMTSLLNCPWRLVDHKEHFQWMKSRYGYFYNETNLL